MLYNAKYWGGGETLANHSTHVFGRKNFGGKLSKLRLLLES